MNQDNDIEDEAPTSTDAPAGSATENRELPPAARRALAEAEERRRKAADDDKAKEVGGRDGPDPVRYGDWEKNGIISDF